MGGVANEGKSKGNEAKCRQGRFDEGSGEEGCYGANKAEEGQPDGASRQLTWLRWLTWPAVSAWIGV